jgi:hypothetical protein
MTTTDLQKLADLHFECYQAALGLKLFSEANVLTEKRRLELKDQYLSAHREVIKITNEHGAEGFGNLETITRSEIAA